MFRSIIFDNKIKRIKVKQSKLNYVAVSKSSEYSLIIANNIMKSRRKNVGLLIIVVNSSKKYNYIKINKIPVKFSYNLFQALFETLQMVRSQFQLLRIQEYFQYIYGQHHQLKFILQFDKSIIFFKILKMASIANSCSLKFTNFLVSLSESQIAFLQLQQILPMNLCKDRTSLQSNDGKGKWTFAQQRQYIIFLNENIDEMREKSTRKSKKVFLQMSLKVKTRTADQCRSHHQKILMYHGSLEQIIRHYTDEVYSYEKIFGHEKAKTKKSIENMKTSIVQQSCEQLKLWVEGNKVKILIKSGLISDY